MRRGFIGRKAGVWLASLALLCLSAWALPAPGVALHLRPVTEVTITRSGSEPGHDSPRASAVIVPTREQLRNGDLIFRSGVGADSQLVKLLDGRSPYSHVGLLDVRSGIPRVVHIEPGTDAESTVRVDGLAAFVVADRADGFAVFRVRPFDAVRSERALDAALRYRRLDVRFDAFFDLETTQQMYCTELVWRAYLDAGLDLVDGHFDHSRMTFGSRPIVTLSDLIASSHLLRVNFEGLR